MESASLVWNWELAPVPGRAVTFSCFTYLSFKIFNKWTWFIFGTGMETADTANLGCPGLAEAQVCNRCSLCFMQMTFKKKLINVFIY